MLEVSQQLNKFGKSVVKDAKRSLARRKSYGTDTKNLLGSIGYDLKVHKNSFSMSFFMLDYGTYIDEGVSGTKQKYNTRFSYKRKGPPIDLIEKWVQRKGLKGRGKDGKFISHRSLSFLISRNIKNKGIKPTLFFTKPFENHFSKLPDEVLEAYGLELDEFLEQTLNA